LDKQILHKQNFFGLSEALTFGYSKSTTMSQFYPMIQRPRRNRKSEVIRGMVEETSVSTRDLIFPLFLIEGRNQKTVVESMPGIFRLSADLMLKEIEECLNIGLQAFDIFPAVEDNWKDKTASKSYDPDFFYLKALREIKSRFPEACIMTCTLIIF
jgi:porphobilinogen synthase